MSKKNKEINHLFFLFQKMTKVLFGLGILTLNTSYSNMFFKNLRRIDSSHLIIGKKDNFIFGFKKNYCGVNTFVPIEFKNYWISDHHLLSVFYSFSGRRNFSIIPYDGQLYMLNFNRTCLYNSTLDHTDNLQLFQSITKQHPLLNSLIPWINLFIFNRDWKVFNRYGLVFPELIKFDKDIFQDQIKYYQYDNGIHHIADARKKIKNTFESILASITMS